MLRQRWFSLAAGRVLCLLALATVTAAGCAAEVDDFDDEEAAVAAVSEGLIIGTDDRTALFPSSLVDDYPWRAVAAVRLTPNTTTANCSAFKVGPRHLLSAAHCFYDVLADGSF